MARRDRCGAQISEELLANAYCRAQGLDYVGAVGRAHFDEHRRLCELLRLPLPVPTLPQAYADYVLVDPADYSDDRFPENELLGGSFRLALRRSVAHLLDRPAARHLDVALHLRRGDVQPTGRWASRYLPSSYFLDILQKLRARDGGLRATVYSEADSAEPFDAFVDLGCELRLDTDAGEAWVAMMQADVLVMSQSAFSWVPALYNRNVVIYAPCWYACLDPWVDSSSADFDARIDRFLARRNAARAGETAPG
jgi:hypothetical protein